MQQVKEIIEQSMLFDTALEPENGEQQQPGVKLPSALPQSHEFAGGISDTSAGRRHPVRC